MKQRIQVNLNEHGQWLLFRGAVCHAMTENGYKGDAWEFSGDLDMSFDEVSGKPLEEWWPAILSDMDDYKADNPGDFHQ